MTTLDPVTVELIRSSLYYASEEMGIALRNSSYSPNIKERMDHSATIFDSEGRLLAQAEHIPVHLGSLPWGLKNIIEYCQKEGLGLEEGSMIVANNPYIAGTHLNDLTVVRPVYHRGGLVAYAANKAHHADVGGVVPGSISIDAKTIFEEGFIMNPVQLMRRNEFLKETVSLAASNSRSPVERIGDLKAQVAANITGERRILQLIERYGLENFLSAAEKSFDYTERIMRSRISATMNKGTFQAKDYVEDPNGRDITLRVKLTVLDDRIHVDYSGTDRQVPYAINAVFGVTLSGVHFVVRTLIGDDVPMNEGAFRVVDVYSPEGTVLHASFPYPVAGGNLETSQRNADLLYLAFSQSLPEKVPAASGGSMNNVMIGGMHEGKSWAFYETIGVGLGGRYAMDGLDGIQANMTNTMNTPIEEIERSMPILIRRYGFRSNSCGAGQSRGGSGLVRAYEMLAESTTFTVLSERGRHEPYGLLGGSGGARAKVILYRNHQGRLRKKRLPIKQTAILKKGDIVEMQTAGGGGYGNPKNRDRHKVLADLENEMITKSYARRLRWRV